MRPKVTANPADCLRCAKRAESRTFPGVRAISPVCGRAFRAGAILDGGRTSLPLSRPKILTQAPDLAARSSVRTLDNGRTSLPRSRPKSAMLLRARGQGRAVRFWTGAVLHSACGVQNSDAHVLGRSPYFIPFINRASAHARRSCVCRAMVFVDDLKNPLNDALGPFGASCLDLHLIQPITCSRKLRCQLIARGHQSKITTKNRRRHFKDITGFKEGFREEVSGAKDIGVSAI